MQIAICDDDEGCCSQIEKWLDLYRRQEKVDLNISIYNRAEILLQQMNAGYWFDVIFLDIELPEQSGIQLGCAIRNQMKNEEVNIVYISGRTRYCKDLFEMQPLNFHHKPLKQEQIIGDIKKVAKKIGERRKYFTYTEDGITRGVSLADIMYVKAMDKAIEITVKENCKITVRDSVQRLAREFADYSVCQCHRSYLVNLSYVEKYLDRCFYMVDGMEIPVGKSYLKEVKMLWAKYGLEVW